MPKRPSHGRWLSHSWAYRTNVWYSPCGEVSRSGGALALLAICLRKSVPPGRGARKPPRVRRVCFSLRLAASTVRGSGSPPSLFPGGHSPVPLRSTSGFPSRENPETHGAPAGQDSVPQGGSQGRARSAVENPRIASQVINLDIEIQVG